MTSDRPAFYARARFAADWRIAASARPRGLRWPGGVVLPAFRWPLALLGPGEIAGLCGCGPKPRGAFVYAAFRAANDR